MSELQRRIQGFPKQERVDQRGMSLLEMLVAVSMLMVFTGVVAMVIGFTTRFLGASESGERNEFELSNGVLIDQQELLLAMDQLVDVLSQPGISRDWLDGQKPGKAQIAFDPDQVDPINGCPAADPVSQWGVPMPPITLPPGYRLCLWKTTAFESSQAALLAKDVGAQPGIYLLQALPERLSSSTLPIRRLFCRPRPFC